jgi:hypothetical protein
MGKEHPPGTVWQAQELYCVDRFSFDRVAELTGVSATTLKAWADKFGWREKREQIAQDECDIRVNRIRGRKVVLDRLLNSDNGMVTAQLSFAVSALETLAMKQQELAASGKIPAAEAEARPVIVTRADAVAALRTAVENKLGLALADPQSITSATVKDVAQCLALVDELEAGLPKAEIPEEAARRGLSGGLKQKILDVMGVKEG